MSKELPQFILNPAYHLRTALTHPDLGLSVNFTYKVTGTKAMVHDMSVTSQPLHDRSKACSRKTSAAKPTVALGL